MEQVVIDIIIDGQKELRSDVKALNSKVDLILEWKWKLVGGTIVVSSVLTLLFQLGLTIVSKGN
jgi:hypothetical protein